MRAEDPPDDNDSRPSTPELIDLVKYFWSISMVWVSPNRLADGMIQVWCRPHMHLDQVNKATVQMVLVPYWSRVFSGVMIRLLVRLNKSLAGERYEDRCTRWGTLCIPAKACTDLSNTSYSEDISGTLERFPTNCMKKMILWQEPNQSFMTRGSDVYSHRWSRTYLVSWGYLSIWYS